MDIGDRIKSIRKSTNLTQIDFAKKLGLSRNAIASYEGGVRIPNEAMIKLICTTYKVDPFWLETGEGDMFTAIPESIIDSLVDEFDLDNRDRYIIEAYLQAPESQRNAIKDFLLTLAEKSAKKNEE